MLEESNIYTDWNLQSSPPELTTSTHVWLIDLTSCSTKDFADYLSPQESEKASRYYFNKDKNTYLICRLSLRFLLSKYLKIAPNKIKFSYNEFGKPSLHKSMNNQINFNVSHSGRFGMIAFNRYHRIGVDIELIKTIDFFNIANSVFSTKEIEELLLTEKEHQSEFFYCGWTRKESFIKALGLGLSYPLKSFGISLNKKVTRCEVNIYSDQEKKRGKWNVYDLDFHPDYCAALSLKAVDDVKLEKFILHCN